MINVNFPSSSLPFCPATTSSSQPIAPLRVCLPERPADTIQAHCADCPASTWAAWQKMDEHTGVFFPGLGCSSSLFPIPLFFTRHRTRPGVSKIVSALKNLCRNLERGYSSMTRVWPGLHGGALGGFCGYSNGSEERGRTHA